MKIIEGNYVRCSSAGKICYTEWESGIVINSCKKHIYMGGRQWAKSFHGHSKSIPRRKYYCKDCGYFHLTHMALYNIDSRNYAWEDVFYREYERRQKSFVRKERFFGISRFDHINRCCDCNCRFQ